MSRPNWNKDILITPTWMVLSWGHMDNSSPRSHWFHETVNCFSYLHIKLVWPRIKILFRSASHNLQRSQKQVFLFTISIQRCKTPAEMACHYWLNMLHRMHTKNTLLLNTCVSKSSVQYDRYLHFCLVNSGLPGDIYKELGVAKASHALLKWPVKCVTQKKLTTKQINRHRRKNASAVATLHCKIPRALIGTSFYDPTTFKIWTFLLLLTTSIQPPSTRNHWTK